MKIAVTYDNGNVFEHFGRTEEFKIYNIENYTVASSEVISANGAGHEALAGVLAEQGVDVLLCGGMGEGAKSALDAFGIEVVTGVQGNTDEAVVAFLGGELQSAGVNCDHHEEEEAGCGCGCGGGCGDDDGAGCGGCGGGCGGCGGSYTPPFDGPNVGKVVRVHYTGTLNDGTKFDSSYDRGETLEFTCGAGQMILGFDAAVAGMEVGEVQEIHLIPELAYGMPDPNAIMTFPLEQMPGAEELKAGDRVYLSNPWGQQFPVTVVEVTDATVTFDANHEMAGKELNFTIELVEIVG